MDTLATPFGWLFVTLAAFFALGLAAPFAPRFYPGTPDLRRRLAAPIIFALLAAACFAGLALPALTLTVLLGGTQVFLSRRRGRKQTPVV